MADSNAPEHKDRGLFGMFGKKDEKQDQHVQQQSHAVDPHATHAPSYTGQGEGANAHGGYAQPHQYGQGTGGNAYGGQAQPHQSHSVDPFTTHTPSYTGQGEGGNVYGGQAQTHQSHSVDSYTTHTPSYTGQGEGANVYGGQAQTHQSHSVDPYTTHTPSYTGQGEGANAHGGHAQPHQYGRGTGGNAYDGEVHHAPPSAISHQTQYYGQEEGGRKQHEGKLHRSNGSSSSSSDEDEDGGKKERKEGRKKKGMKEKPHGYDGETETQEWREEKGMMDKIKEKLPGSHGGILFAFSASNHEIRNTKCTDLVYIFLSMVTVMRVHGMREENKVGMYIFRNGERQSGYWHHGVLQTPSTENSHPGSPIAVNHSKVLNAVQEARHAAEKAYEIPRVDERVNKVVSAANRAANAARVVAVKAVQKRMQGNTPIPDV